MMFKIGRVGQEAARFNATTVAEGAASRGAAIGFSRLRPAAAPAPKGPRAFGNALLAVQEKSLAGCSMSDAPRN